MRTSKASYYPDLMTEISELFPKLDCELKLQNESDQEFVLISRKIVEHGQFLPDCFVILILDHFKSLSLKLVSIGGKTLLEESIALDGLKESIVCRKIASNELKVCQKFRDLLSNCSIATPCLIVNEEDGQFCKVCHVKNEPSIELQPLKYEVDIEMDGHDLEFHPNSSDDEEEELKSDPKFAKKSLKLEPRGGTMSPKSEQDSNSDYDVGSGDEGKPLKKRKYICKDSLQKKVEAEIDEIDSEEGFNLESEEGHDLESKVRKKKKSGTKKGIMQCPMCQKAYKTLFSFKKHVKNCKKGLFDLSVCTCQICLFVANSQDALKSHMELHVEKLGDIINLPMTCPVCDKELKSSHELNSHYQSDHDTQRAICVICKGIYKADFLHKHVRIKHQSKKHLCSICGKEFDQVLRLSIHLNTFHSTTTEHRVVCDQCGKTFPHKERLRQHKYFYHKYDTSKNTCEYCGKTFSNLSQLYKHRRIHSKVKPYQCALCGYQAVVKSNVRLHIKKVHKQDEVAQDEILTVGKIELETL